MVAYMGTEGSLPGAGGTEVVVFDPDIIKTVGVRRIGWGTEHDDWLGHEGRYWDSPHSLERPKDNDYERAFRAQQEHGDSRPHIERINRIFEQSSGQRSQRLTQADLNQRRSRTPKENLEELGEAIDEYVAFLQEHHRHNFGGDADTISAIDASNPGLVNEHDVLKGRVDDLAWVFEEARAD